MRHQSTSSVEELTTSLDLILDTVTDHAHWQLHRGFSGYKITLFLDATFLGAINTNDVHDIVYLELGRARETLAEALEATIDCLLTTIADVYNDDHAVAA